MNRITSNLMSAWHLLLAVVVMAGLAVPAHAQQGGSNYTAQEIAGAYAHGRLRASPCSQPCMVRQPRFAVLAEHESDFSALNIHRRVCSGEYTAAIVGERDLGETIIPDEHAQGERPPACLRQPLPHA